MKYIVILFVVIVLVRIDVVLHLFDKTSQKIENSKNRDDLSSTPTDVPQTELVPIESDLALKTSNKKIFLSMMEDFRSAPELSLKDRAIETLRATPTMFDEKLDAELEATIFRWRGLIEQKNKVAQGFILELMKSLKGENLEMLKRFLSYAIDVDFADFISFYSKTNDLNCLLITYLGDNLPDEEKYNELNERLKFVEAYIASDKADLKEYAQRCHLVLKLTVDKLGASTAPPEEQQPAPVAVDPTITPAPGSSP
jgi:hypothetical protein